MFPSSAISFCIYLALTRPCTLLHEGLHWYRVRGPLAAVAKHSFLFFSLSLSFAHFAVKVYMLGHLQIMDVNLPIMVQLSNY